MKKDVKTILVLLVFTIGVLSVGSIKSKVNQKMNHFSEVVTGQTTVNLPTR